MADGMAGRCQRKGSEHSSFEPIVGSTHQCCAVHMASVAGDDSVSYWDPVARSFD